MKPERYGGFEAGMRTQFDPFIASRDFHQCLSVLSSVFISGKVFGCRSVTPCLGGAKVLFLVFCLCNITPAQETGTLVQGALVNSVNGPQIPPSAVALPHTHTHLTVPPPNHLRRFPP